MTLRNAKSLTRRDAIKFSAATVATAAVGLPTPPARANGPAPVDAPDWLTLLGRSERGGRDAVPAVEGEIPRGLAGTLFRNGPGLFERGGVRKRHLLDGDGLVQGLTFHDGQVRYRNAFVRTRKLEEEAAAGKYLYATWSTRKPGGMLANMGLPHVESQAGVTVYPFGGGLYAFDEVSPPYALDPQTLRTVGPHPFGDPRHSFAIKAHTKLDPLTGDWLMAGIDHGRTLTLHLIVHGADGGLKSHRTIESPRQVYIHDFFATERHFVFLLHPMHLSLWGLLAGVSTYIESMEWRGGDGNLVVVVPRDGGAPRIFEAAGAFMWHALNAYERDGEIVADFVGYDAPDHFSPDDALFYTLMAGKMGRAEHPGTLRRYRIDLAGGTLGEETVDTGTHEFPMVDARVATRPHRTGYLASGGRNLLHSGIKRIDLETGRTATFDFGRTAVVGEPVFAAKPGGAVDQGWLIAQVLEGDSGTTFFAVFDAETVDQGPLAKVRLDHHVPISFHGWWAGA